MAFDQDSMAEGSSILVEVVLEVDTCMAAEGIVGIVCTQSVAPGHHGSPM